MARRQPLEPAVPAVNGILTRADTSVLDLLDRLLEKGVMANGDLTLGLAGVDLIYIRVAALLCAADRVLPQDPNAVKRKSRHRSPRSGRR
jgi:hypothetical protein